MDFNCPHFNYDLMNNSLVDDMEVLPVTAALSTIRVSLGVF